MEHLPWSLIAWFSTVKGLLIAAVTLVIGTTLGDSLLVAFVSGGLGILGMVISARIAAKEATKNRQLLHDVKGQLGAAKRRTDAIDQRDTDAEKTERGGS